MKAIKPPSIEHINQLLLTKEKNSPIYIDEFKNEIIDTINSNVLNHDFALSNSIDTEIDYILWYGNYRYKLLAKHIKEVFEIVTEEFERVGWHVFSSLGSKKLMYFTLTVKEN